MPFTRKFFAVAAAMALVVSVRAQEPATSAKPESPAEFKALRYRNIGPAAGGRVSRAAGVPGNPQIYYAATASGGVWMSSDAGTSWRSVWDDQPISSIGSIAVAPSDPNVVYVGSGEANIRGNVAAGNGIYRSSDGGKTWSHVWHQEGQIGTMAVHPKNAEVAFAAVLGHAFGPNPERGVYRTRDGGRTWQQVLKKDADTGASDVAIDPSNPNVIFAGLWQARRYPWDMTSGGPGSGLYVSRDGGDTWKHLTGGGLPEGIWGKVGIAIAPSDSRRVYALIEADKGGLFRSDDGGENWDLASPHRALRQRAWYYTTLAVHPANPNEVWFPQVPMLKSIDGGKTIEEVKGLSHGDHHDVWFDPANPKRMIVANDGGVNISHNGGANWSAPMLPISQFYHVSVDTRRPYHIAGAMQDLGTAQGPSDSLARNIHLTDWHDVGGGEAGHVYSDPGDPNIVYAGEYLGIITRYDHRTRESRNISAWPENPSGLGGEDMRYRFQWTAPITGSPFDPKVVYHGAQVIFRTRDGGQTWTAISQDLTRNDKSKQKWSGGPITGDNTGVETYGTVFAIAESPKQKGLIWAGSDDGLVHVTADDGKTWKNVTAAMPGFPEWGTVSMIEPSPFDADTAYVVVDAHRLDDMKPYLFRTGDRGATWKRIDAGLAANVYLHAVREDPEKRGQLYLGTERGVMFSTDDGQSWRPLQLNLPTVAVHDLQVKEGDLVVGTHGRSIWILDDLQPVRQYDARVAAEALHLFPPQDAIRWRYGSSNWGTRGGFPNPPHGAVIYYALKDEEKGDLKIEIVDARNRIVRTLSSTAPKPMGSGDFESAEDYKDEALPRGAGVQRAVWDLAYEGAAKIQGGRIDTGDPREGPRVPPGTYTVKLTAAGRTLSAPLKVLPDPRGDLPQTDLEAQAAFAVRVRDDISKLTGLVNDLRSVQTQLKGRNATLEARKSEADIADLIGQSEAAIKRALAIESKLHNPAAEVVYDILAMRGGAKLYSRLAPLQMWVSESSGVPTQGMMQVLVEQEKELAALEAETKQFLNADVTKINQRAAQLNLNYVIVK
ncbi:MAG TPA: hypothetical protein VFK57_19530 [Vicinamibacterales bacterium]|nr:hypothetical protein [Vicinamibacterales bacterium]